MAVLRGFPSRVADADRPASEVFVAFTDTDPDPFMPPPLPDGGLKGFREWLLYIALFWALPAVAIGLTFGLTLALKTGRLEWPIFAFGACLGFLVGLFRAALYVVWRNRKGAVPKTPDRPGTR